MLLPMIGALVSIPVILKQIGEADFGALSLVWVLVGYFSILDLGLGRALTYHVAVFESEKDQEKLAGLCSTGMLLALLIGGAGIVIVLALFYVASAYGLVDVGNTQFRYGIVVAALSLPFVVMGTALRGIFEGFNQFRLLNAIRGPTGALMFVLPALAVLVSPSFEIAVGATVLVRIVSYVVMQYLAVRLVPMRISLISLHWCRSMLAFGGWLAVSNFVAPLIVYGDRFLIAMLVGATALAYYSAPFEVVSKLIMIPTVLTAVLFPLLSRMQSENVAQAKSIRLRAEWLLAILIVPAVIVGAVLAHWALEYWLGYDFAVQSTVVLQILIVGVGINALTNIPYTVLQSYGNTRAIALIHLAEFPLYAVLLYGLTLNYGVEGSAFAWSARALVDFVLMRWVMRRTEMLAHTNGAANAIG